MKSIALLTPSTSFSLNKKCHSLLKHGEKTDRFLIQEEYKRINYSILSVFLEVIFYNPLLN